MKVIISTPLVATTFQIPSYTVSPQDYRHDLAVTGGYYKSASISYQIDPIEVDFWFTYGLGCHVEVYDDYAIKIWEGFVDQISVSLGPLSFKYGPLSNIGNRITVRYTDFTTGQAARTTAANDTISQSKYGIWHKVLSTSSVSSTTAEKLRATYLLENKLPEVSPTISFTGADTILTLDCVGYGAWLNYPYNQATDTTYTLREKILEVIGQSPNAIFSSNYGMIETNTLSVNRLDNDDRLASTIIEELVALGGTTSNDRRILGVYANREVRVQAIPTTTQYTVRTAEPGIIRDAVSGIPVDPANIEAGKWVQILDFLPGLTASTLREDPRMVFIENVSYTAPYEFNINGGKTGTFSQQIAKLVYGG